jgi:anti-anti-sigma factor
MFMSGSARSSQTLDAPGLPRATPAVTVLRSGPAASPREERGYLVTALSGRIDSARAPALREQLLRLLRPAASQLVLDLTLVSDIDAAGLAVLVGTERRARLLGGSLRLAGARPAVSMAVHAAGLDWLLGSFATVQAAVSSPAPA